MSLEDRLQEWLPRQRWFAGKDNPPSAVRILAQRTLHEGAPDGGPALAHALVAVERVIAGAPAPVTVTYQLLLGVRPDLPPRLEHALIGWVDGLGAVYDATHDSELMRLVPTWMAEGYTSDGIAFAREPGAVLDPEAPSQLLTAEQSNTSVVFGEHSVLKLFRRVVPGVNPDLEVTRALTEAGNAHVAAVQGWIEGDVAQRRSTLGMMQAYLRSGTDGWALALTSVRDLFAEGDLHADEVGGDFAGESERLGLATADVHLTLAQVLPSGEADAAFVESLATGMRSRLDAASVAVPALGTHAPAIAEVFDRLAREHATLDVQRVHGDYHLGQVMRTDTGWVLLDFEGEPGAPIAERAAPSSPLRDVAGMLRSFDYAAHYLLADHARPAQLEYRAAEWAERNREAFCTGYAKGAGNDPRDDDVVLRAFELDKAVYEVVYEARNRPDWVRIPLGSIERLLAA